MNEEEMVSSDDWDLSFIEVTVPEEWKIAGVNPVITIQPSTKGEYNVQFSIAFLNTVLTFDVDPAMVKTEEGKQYASAMFDMLSEVGQKMLVTMIDYMMQMIRGNSDG